jgi:N-acetyltransferase
MSWQFEPQRCPGCSYWPAWLPGLKLSHSHITNASPKNPEVAWTRLPPKKISKIDLLHTHNDETPFSRMIKRKYGARNALPQQETSIKRQRIQFDAASDPLQIPRQSSSSSTPKTSLEAWLKPSRLTVTQKSSPTLQSETPPSSPPPSASHSEPESPQLLKIRKPTFAFLRQPRLAPIPLSDTNSSANERKPQIQTRKLRRDAKLTQLTIDLGGPTTITCPECAMSYTPSQPDDAVLHMKYHATQLAKMNVSSEVWKHIRDTACWKDAAIGGYIISVSRDDKVSLKNLVERMLVLASQDLGAVEISRTQLWSTLLIQGQEKGRYRTWLYLQNRKCIGLLLAEYIDAAFEVKDLGVGRFSDKSAPLEISEASVPATVGVSRIWTLRTERRGGVAIKLLEAALLGWRYKHSSISKSQMAFSQPTEMGTALARKWFGKEHGWLVYRD